ncbi:MAG: heme biosynthesis HemY N-terminal domain-containing protein [Beijerinckiaceae bacterium]|jgi:HemY protein
MIRILIYLLILAVVAFGVDWLLQQPGHVEIVWDGYQVSMTAAVGFGMIVLAAIALSAIWGLVRFVFGLPSFVALARRQRRREKGYAALSRGLIAAGAGDARGASQASILARKHLKDDPLAIVLQATAARLSGDGARAEAFFAELAQRADTHLLGLRGLHDEAFRRGDGEAAGHFAAEAHQVVPLPWSAQTLLAHKAAESRWEEALETVDTSIKAKLVDRATGDRQRAVLQTAIGLEKQDIAPDEALALARAAIKRAPDLVPAIALAARLYTRRGEIRKATRLIETVWPRCPHPELARIYLDVRPGDSTSDRLARAQALMRISPYDPVSRITVARAALAARDFARAREAMAPLIAEGKRPSVRACIVMADLEDAEFGDKGHWREWLARASRAPLDPAWIADGIVYEQWEPVSPTTGRLDAFVWQAPADRPGQAMEAMPASVPPEALPQAGRQALVAETAQSMLAHYDGTSPGLEASIKPVDAGQGGKGGGSESNSSGPDAGEGLDKKVAAPKSSVAPSAGTGRRDTPFKLKSTVAPDDPGVEASPSRTVFQGEDITPSL